MNTLLFQKKNERFKSKLSLSIRLAIRLILKLLELCMKKILSIIFVLSLIPISAFAKRGEYRQIKISACEGKEVGEACTFEGRRGVVQGVCSEGRRDPEVVKCKNPNRKKFRRGRRSKQN